MMVAHRDCSTDNPPPKVVQGYKVCSPRMISHYTSSPALVQHLLSRSYRQVQGTHVQDCEGTGQRRDRATALQCWAPLRRHRVPHREQRMGVLPQTVSTSPRQVSLIMLIPSIVDSEAASIADAYRFGSTSVATYVLTPALILPLLTDTSTVLPQVAVTRTTLCKALLYISLE